VTLRHCCVLLPRERNKRDEHNVTRDGELRVTIKAETDRPGTYRMRGEDDRFNRIEHRLQLLQWQLGALIAVIVPAGTGMLWLLLRVASKVGALS